VEHTKTFVYVKEGRHDLRVVITEGLMEAVVYFPNGRKLNLSILEARNIVRKYQEYGFKLQKKGEISDDIYER
jgi:hypothetical protein